MKKSILIAAILFIAVQAAAFQMPDTNLNLIKGKTKGFDIVNAYDSPMTVRVTVETETIREIPKDSPDCSKNLKIFPKIFQVQPKQSQTVKFLSRQKGKCRVFFEVDKDNPDQMDLGMGAVINMRYRIGIPVSVE